MATKDALQNRIDELERRNQILNDKIDELTAANKSLSMAVGTLPELEVIPEGIYRAQENNIQSRNWKVRDAACLQFAALKQWAGRNIGYGDSDEEKQATGLGCLLHFKDVDVAFAVRFAAEVAIQENYSGEGYRLGMLWDKLTNPAEYMRQETNKQSVSSWAE